MKTLLILLALTATAHADGDAITTQPLALVARGVNVGYERAVAPRLSIAGSAAYRSAAEGDYDSSTWTIGGDLRYWPRAALHGCYVGLHASAGRTAVTDTLMHADLGTSLEITERVEVGWRFTIEQHFAITPSLGVGMHHDVAHGLATITSPSIALGLELGWLF